MQAILKTPSNVVARSKVIQGEFIEGKPSSVSFNSDTVLNSCRCQGWKKHQNLSSCPSLLTPSRLLSSITKCSVPASSIHLRKKHVHQSYLYLSPSVMLLETSSSQGCNLTIVRNFSVGHVLLEKEPLKPSSKVEETVKAIKEKAEKSEAKAVTPEPPKAVKKSLKQKIWHELVHYYHGFRLLFIDINISRKLLWRVLQGKTLSRREHRLLVRTVGDLFRLLPFSVFIIVPFMEFLLPLAIKLFPGMLPSTFQTATEKEDKLKQSLKVRLEMAKFLQTTLDDMSVQSKDKHSQAAKEFTDFFKKIKSSGEAPSNEEIIKFSTLFEDEITLDSLSRQQLTALCRVLDINPMGTTNLLRFQIRMRLRNLAADDKMIMKEGIDSLTIQELQSACQARAMRAYGVSEDKLKSQLSQWLDLSVNEKVPPSLLLLSRALMPDTVATSDQLKATISALPDTVELKAKAAISEREGSLDNKTKIELIKAEERRIQEERAEQREESKKKKREDEEALVDKAPVIRADTGAQVLEDPAVPKEEEITTKDLETLEHALDALGKEKKKMILEKEELNELKEELQDYEEDVKELKEVLATREEKPKIRETKAAKNLFKKVNSMIAKMDSVLGNLENKTEQIKAAERQAKQQVEELVKIDELIDVIKRIQKVEDSSKIEQISKVLGKIDDDHDGAISVDDVLKVIELIGKENVQLSSKQIDEILELIDKEEALELEGQIEKALEKQSLTEKVPQTKAAVKETSQPKESEKESGDQSGKADPKQAAAMSVSPNENTNKATILEPKDVNNDTTKKL